MAELGGAQRKAGIGRGRGCHVRVRGGGRGSWERGFELVVRVGDVGGLVVRVDGRRRQEPVRVVVGADAKGHLVNYSASLWVGQTVTVLEESGRARGQDGVGVVGCVGWVRQQGRGGGVRGAAVGQVCEGVDIWGDESMRSQGPKVAVPFFVVV